MVTMLLACGTTSSRAATGVDPRLKTFAAQKRQQMEELAAKLHLDVPPEAREFFKAAEAGDWNAVSNTFERIRPGLVTNAPLPSLNNVLFVPIHEVFWAYDEFNDWDAAMLQKFADGILHSLATGSIYFGGTDPGRFVITAVRDVAKSPDIVVITQNLPGVDGRYTDYIRSVYGDRIWLPSEKDVQQAVQQSAPDVNSVNGVMRIIDTVTKTIFDNNKDKHGFYVEEGYVIGWMYPYLEPHGLILKLNKQPLAQLDVAVVAQDRKFWDAMTKELLANHHFTGNDAARKTYSKQRSAIGGLYAYRHMTNEAEAVFIQSRQLYPASPEPNFRLAQLYMELGRTDDAIAVLAQLQKLDPLNDKIGMAIEQLRKLKRPAEEKQVQ